MPLANSYTLATSRIPELFEKIRDGQAPDQFSQQLLKDWGFTSSSDRALIPMLKALGFLSPDGKPTSFYHDYRDHSRSKGVIAQALRQSYSDLFLIKANPGPADKAAIQGKFKSFHNVSDKVAGLMTKTFLALVDLADFSSNTPTLEPPRKEYVGKSDAKNETFHQAEELYSGGVKSAPGLHYNIQIHLPATKDVEVFNAIFKSLKQHLFDE